LRYEFTTHRDLFAKAGLFSWFEVMW
jgi:hypothetical protein